jgi:ring-1,2-phenylacetyl-CoA epoxidase subunit PaaE
MSIHFHPLKIKEVRQETADCVSIAFDIPANLQEEFQYTQGQSLTIRTQIGGQEVRRTYSICSSPLDKEWRVAVKKVEGGLFSSFANLELKAGDTLEVMQPVGRFYSALDPDNRKNYIAFAAGSGITPVLSIIKTTLTKEPLSQFTLVYGNRNRASIIFFEELEALKNQFMQRFNMVHVLSREKTDSAIHSGRIDTTKLNELKSLIPLKDMDEFFLCGPEEMIFTVKDYLETTGIDKKKIHFELFTSPGQQAATAVSTGTATASGPESRVTVKLDGRSFDFGLSFNSETSILDAALQQGADLPYACKGGMCCTCKAKLLEGEVKMDVHWGLEEEEVANGFILTCQSHPVSEKVVVDFDIR